MGEYFAYYGMYAYNDWYSFGFGYDSTYWYGIGGMYDFDGEYNGWYGGYYDADGWMTYYNAMLYGDSSAAGFFYMSNDIDIDDWLDSYYFPWNY